MTIQRPLPVSIICWLAITIGILGMTSAAYIVRDPEILIFIGDTHLSIPLKITLLSLGAIAQFVGAIGMLKAKNWARVLYLAAILTAPFVWRINGASLIASLALCAVQAFFLFAPRANEYFNSQVAKRYKNVFLTLAVAGAIAFALTVQAQNIDDGPQYKNIWKHSQSLRDIPSTDPTPVEFTFEGAKYRVPRNYLVHLEGPLTLPTFRVTYPGFKPLTEETRQCLTQPRAYWPPGCVPIEFWLGGNQPPHSDDNSFNNAMKSFSPSLVRKDGPGGLELYQYGQGDKRTDYYRKKTSRHTLVIWCMYYDSNGHPDAVCSNYNSPLPNGNDLSYRIDLNQLENAEKIDDGIRALIDSFTLKGDTP